MLKRFLVCFAAIVIASSGLGAGEDPLLGTWKINLAKSKFSPGPPERNEILKFEPAGDNAIKFTAEITDAQGKTVVTHFAGKFDGKEIPVTGGTNGDTTVMKRIDPYTTERINKQAGNVTTILRRVVSKDGRTMTITTTGKNIAGQTVHDVVVFDRQ